MSSSKSQSALGFLTVLTTDEQALIGGYLILNEVGRPLEFHCTAPVKANRAQQILFGPTLQPFLYGEQIGQTLVGKGSLKPLAIYTDVASALSVRDFIEVPVALVMGAGAEVPAAAGGAVLDEPGGAADTTSRANGPAVCRLTSFPLGNNRLAVPDHYRRDQDTIQQRLAVHAELDLIEPFERIREAIEEAHKQSRP